MYEEPVTIDDPDPISTKPSIEMATDVGIDDGVINVIEHYIIRSEETLVKTVSIYEPYEFDFVYRKDISVKDICRFIQTQLPSTDFIVVLVSEKNYERVISMYDRYGNKI